MRVLFAGTPDFAVPALQALVSEHQVIGVYTQPDRASGRGKKISQSAIKQVAVKHNLPIYQPQTLRDQVDNIKQLNPDVFVVVAFGMLLPQNILDIPLHGCINIHGSILPRWRGAAPIQRAIEAGDLETGVSIMRMEAGLDTGPIYQILKTEVNQDDTSLCVHERLAELGARGVCETLNEIESRSLSKQPPLEPVKQDDALANYAKKIKKEEAQINWQDSAEQIQRKIRAFNPWPICQTYHDQTRLRLWRSSVVELPVSSALAPGQVLCVDKSGITVACGSNARSNLSALKLEILQRDGSKALTTKELLNGYLIQAGDILAADDG